MKAMLYRTSGGPEVLEYTDVADPVPARATSWWLTWPPPP